MRFLLICVLGIFGSFTASGSQLVRGFEEKLDGHEARLRTGAVIIVSKDEILYSRAFGFQKIGGSPNTVDTLFPLASASKPISATLAVYLSKKKQLSLDEKADSFAPGIDSRISLINALSHTTGFRDREGNKAIESGRDRFSLFRLFEQRKPEYTPGSYYSYSNVFFSLLENAIDKNLKTSFSGEMSRFLSQIGVRNAGVCQVPSGSPVAFPHRKGKRKPLRSLEAPSLYPNTVCSAAGLFMSAKQMGQFIQVMLGKYPDVIGKKETEILFQPQIKVTDIFWKWPIQWPYPTHQMESSYALGWRTIHHKKRVSKRLIFHGGHLNGVSTFVGILPESGLGIAILSNQDVISAEEAGLDFWKFVAEKS